MAWSIFNTSQGGGSGSAVTWAEDLLQLIGAPESAGNVQVVYDWELSEGGGGAYNPLNQGPDTIHPGLSVTGEQYGGGAADYASWQAGLQGAADYLSMPNFKSIESDLVGNDPTDARAAIIASPWAASHYGNGADFSTAPVPGTATALPDVGGTVTAQPDSLISSTIGNLLGVDSLVKDLVTVGLVMAGAGLVIIGAVKVASPNTTVRQLVHQGVQSAGSVAAVPEAALL